MLLLVAVLAASASVRWSQEAASAGPQGDRLASDIRHMQTISMTQGQRLELDIPASSDRYHVRDLLGSIISNPVTGQPYTVMLEPGTVLAGTNMEIDSLGRPVSGATLISAQTTYTLSAGGQSSTVAVAPVSGFVSVAP